MIINGIIGSFSINLKNHIMVMWPLDKEIKFTFKIDKSEISINLQKVFSHKFMDEGDEYFTEPIYNIIINVLKEGTYTIPSPLKKKGTTDFSNRIEYFTKILPPFSDLAFQAYTRLINFLKYMLYNPYLIEYPREHPFFHNATWYDLQGNVLGSGINKIMVEEAYELEFKLGKKIPIAKLSPKLSKSLLYFLENPFTPKLHSQLISGAITSLFDFNLHRAVFELAIGCEILVKRSFFSEETPAGSAYDYFEDKGKVNITVPEFIDKIAKEAFGRSFKEDHPKEESHIQNLFRCRNKIAHRGSLVYTEVQSNKRKTADLYIVTRWIYAVKALEIWFFKQKGQK